MYNITKEFVYDIFLLLIVIFITITLYILNLLKKNYKIFLENDDKKNIIIKNLEYEIDKINETNKDIKNKYKEIIFLNKEMTNKNIQIEIKNKEITNKNIQIEIKSKEIIKNLNEINIELNNLKNKCNDNYNKNKNDIKNIRNENITDVNQLKDQINSNLKNKVKLENEFKSYITENFTLLRDDINIFKNDLLIYDDKINSIKQIYNNLNYNLDNQQIDDSEQNNYKSKNFYFEDSEINKKEKFTLKININNIEKIFYSKVKQRYINEIFLLLKNEVILIKDYLNFNNNNLSTNPVNPFPLLFGFNEFYLHESGNIVVLNNTFHLLTLNGNNNLTEKIFEKYFYSKLNLLNYERFYINKYSNAILLHNCIDEYKNIPIDYTDYFEYKKLEIKCFEGIKFILLKRRNEFMNFMNMLPNIINNIQVVS